MLIFLIVIKLAPKHTGKKLNVIVLCFSSDQTDPYNRSPLTMDMVKPDTDLQKKINDWIQQLEISQLDTSTETTEDFSIYAEKSE